MNHLELALHGQHFLDTLLLFFPQLFKLKNFGEKLFNLSILFRVTSQ